MLDPDWPGWDNVFQSTLPTRGSDQCARLKGQAAGISIHAPHEGERPQGCFCPSWSGRFQSTLPTRGSDAGFRYSVRACDKFQSTLPTRGSDEWPLGVFVLSSPISIHAPHEGERLATL